MGIEIKMETHEGKKKIPVVSRQKEREHEMTKLIVICITSFFLVVMLLGLLGKH